MRNLRRYLHHGERAARASRARSQVEGRRRDADHFRWNADGPRRQQKKRRSFDEYRRKIRRLFSDAQSQRPNPVADLALLVVIVDAAIIVIIGSARGGAARSSVIGFVIAEGRKWWRREIGIRNRIALLRLLQSSLQGENEEGRNTDILSPEILFAYCRFLS